MNGNKRTRFNVIISAVGNQMLDAFSCSGETLNLVEDNDRFSTIKSYFYDYIEDLDTLFMFLTSAYNIKLYRIRFLQTPRQL